MSVYVTDAVPCPAFVCDGWTAMDCMYVCMIWCGVCICDKGGGGSKTGMSQNKKCQRVKYLSRSLEIKLIWIFDTECPTVSNKTSTYISFKSAVHYRLLRYGYPRGQICPPSRGNHSDVLCVMSCE